MKSNLWNARHLLASLRATTALTMLTMVAPTYAVHDLDLFELDRNAQEEAAVPGSDWDAVLLGAGGGSFQNTGVISDGAPDKIFTGGGSKDDQDIPNWKFATRTGPPDKDDITNAYAAAYKKTIGGQPHLIIYFGLDRFDTSGSAQVGFWFFKNPIGLQSGTKGNFTGQHAVGDILVQSNFTNGGAISSVSVFLWVGGANPLQLLTSGADCVGGVGAGDLACATVNQQNTPAPWSYTDKDGDSGTFKISAFFEGGVDITALLASVGQTPGCFSTFLAETRSSTPFNAVLKDFAGPHAFNTCSVLATKTCTGARLKDPSATPLVIVNDIGGKITNNGFGTLTNVKAKDDNGTSDTGDDFFLTLYQDAAGTNPYPVPVSLPAGADAFVKATFETTANPATNHFTVTADQLTTAVTATAPCEKVSLSPMISVEKTCVTALTVVNSQVVVKVNYSGKVTNTSDQTATPTPLFNVTAADDRPGDTQPLTLYLDAAFTQPLGSPFRVNPGQTVYYKGSYFPNSAPACPANASFTDTVTASGNGAFDTGTATNTGSDTCKLCPAGGCPQ